MNLTSPKYFQAQSIFGSNGVNISHICILLILFQCSNGFQYSCWFLFFFGCFLIQESPLEENTSFYGKSNDNPFVETFPDPLCKLNLKETSDFVKSFPMANNIKEGGGFLEVSAQRRREGMNSVNQRRMEAPSTPGRPVFSFSAGNHSRKSFPSKWDDAEKWLMSSSCHDSPAHPIKPSESSKITKQCDNFKQQVEVFAEKSRVTEEKFSKVVSSFQRSASLDNHNSVMALNGVSASTDVFLKGKGFPFQL